jgi:serine/threonine-protein kinase HipA
LCLKLTAAFGLPSANVSIADFKGNRVLVVQRFDRVWTKDHRLLRLPQEDCCQALSVLPTRRYGADGGPGIADVLELLKGSDDPDTDRRLLLKAQIMFWLLAATEGHAKNFSIFLRPGGRFRLTPLYDVMSAQPACDAGQLQKNKMKLALAVGENRHNVVEEIVPRHFIQTAAKSGIPAPVVEEICAEVRQRAAAAIDDTQAALPADFPGALAASIMSGVRTRLKVLAGVTA